MRKIYVQIDEAWLERLAAIAERERRDVRTQARCVLEYGIARMERELGLVDNQQPPQVIDGVWSSATEVSNEKFLSSASKAQPRCEVLANPSAVVA